MKTGCVSEQETELIERNAAAEPSAEKAKRPAWIWGLGSWALAAAVTVAVINGFWRASTSKEWGDLATWFSGLATLGGLVFAGWSFRIQAKERGVLESDRRTVQGANDRKRTDEFQNLVKITSSLAESARTAREQQQELVLQFKITDTRYQDELKNLVNITASLAQSAESAQQQNNDQSTRHVVDSAARDEQLKTLIKNVDLVEKRDLIRARAKLHKISFTADFRAGVHGKPNEGSWSFKIRNKSPKPIYDVEIYLPTGCGKGEFSRVATIAPEDWHSASGDVPDPQFSSNVNELTSEELEGETVYMEFTDHDGFRWKFHRDGQLENIPTPDL